MDCIIIARLVGEKAIVADRVTDLMFVAFDEEVFFTKGGFFLLLETIILLAKPRLVTTVGFDVEAVVGFFFSVFLFFVLLDCPTTRLRSCAEEFDVVKAKISARNNEALNILLSTAENLINKIYFVGGRGCNKLERVCPTI